MAKRQFIIEFDDDDEYIVETLEELEQLFILGGAKDG